MKPYERIAATTKSDDWCHKGRNGRKVQRGGARRAINAADATCWVHNYCHYKGAKCYEEECSSDCPYAP